MKKNNFGGYASIDEYVKAKTLLLEKAEKNFSSLFTFMFSEEENIFAELSDGFRVKTVTYGEAKRQALRSANALANTLGRGNGELVGLYGNSSAEWVYAFWAILAAGYKPLLMNIRLPKSTLEGIVKGYGVKAVVADGEEFSVPTLPLRELTNATDGEDFAPQFSSEIVFMSSGTSESVKLCAYTGENIYYQVRESEAVIKSCPAIRNHYEGELKQLALLPFYHVFGFIAVYLWFGFYSRTFVFLKDLRPQTLLSTVKRHKVTHIFAVPLVWDTVYKEALRKIKDRGEKTYRKFQKGIRLASKNKFFARLLRGAFKEIRENLFGESIRFMISGGSAVRPKVLTFFNAIGYHLANGYGMTELGITSLEISSKPKILNSASIGVPFQGTEYAVSAEGELLVKTNTRAARILCGEKETITNYDEWLNTRDLARLEGGRYFLEGRKDDLIVSKSGENLNPNLLENSLQIQGVEEFCILSGERGTPTLLLHAKGCYTAEKTKAVLDAAANALRQAKLENEITKILVTSDPLLQGNDFKISRKKLARRLQNGEIRLLSPEKTDYETARSELEKEVCACFAKALNKPLAEISLDSHFFTDLGGTSLEYFTLVDAVKTEFAVGLPVQDGKTATTPREVCEYLNSVS